DWSSDVCSSDLEFLIKKKLFAKIATVALATPLFFVNSGTGTVNAAESSTMVGYNCTGKAAGIIDVDLDMDVNIHASVPDSVKPGEEFTIEESYSDIELDLVDQNVVKETANPLEGNVSTFDFEFDNAVETESGDDVINMVEEGEELEFGPIDFADDAESVGFTVPEGDKLSVDLTAGESGDVEVTAGEIKNTVYANHALIGDIDVDVTC